MPLSDNENCGAETRPRESQGKSSRCLRKNSGAINNYRQDSACWLAAALCCRKPSGPHSLSASLPLQSLMDQYFGRMRSLMNNKDLPARIRFLLQDTVELRENNWVPRKAFIDNGPKTINQIRQDAVKVSRRPPPPSLALPRSLAPERLQRLFASRRIWVFSSQRPCLRG